MHLMGAFIIYVGLSRRQNVKIEIFIYFIYSEQKIYTFVAVAIDWHRSSVCSRYFPRLALTLSWRILELLIFMLLIQANQASWIKSNEQQRLSLSLNILSKINISSRGLLKLAQKWSKYH